MNIQEQLKEANRSHSSSGDFEGAFLQSIRAKMIDSLFDPLALADISSAEMTFLKLQVRLAKHRKEHCNG